MAEMTYWLGWLAGLLIIVIGSYVACRAWFGDRARGRRRCPRCWYDLAYSTGMTCSECGHEARAEAEFTRTRRHRTRGLTAVLITALAVAFLRDQAFAAGWASAIPSRVLIAILPVFDDARNDAASQLISRINRSRLSEENLERLLRRCADGDRGTIPGTDRWVDKYGALLSRLRPMLVAERADPEVLSELERILLDIPPVLRLTSRSSWQKGMSARVGVRLVNWWPVGSDCRMTIVPDDKRAEPVTVLASGSNPPRTDYSFLTPPLEAETTSLNFTISTERRTREDDDAWHAVATQPETVPIRVVERLSDSLIAMDTPEMTTAMERVLVGVRIFESGPEQIRFYVAPNRSGGPQFREVAIGLVVEVLLNSEVVMVDHSWWLGGPDLSSREFGSWSEPAPMKALSDLDFTTGEWTVRARGDADLALRAGDGTYFWSGSFTMPLPIVNVEGEAREPHWWYEEDELN